MPRTTDRPGRAGLIETLSAHELVMLACALLFVLVAIAGRVPAWPEVLWRMSAVSFVILGVNRWAAQSEERAMSGFKLFYVVPLLPIFFKTSELISFPLHGRDFDDTLILIDRAIAGGVDPTRWLFAHAAHPPVLTEYLTICYALFYFLPLALAIELYRRNDRERMANVFFVIIYGFLLSYACYFLFPSVGPRFTVHAHSVINAELPGVWVTELIRRLLDQGENVLPGMTDPEAIRVVTRDAFPSGHCDITLMTMLLAFQYRSALRYGLLIIGSSLIIATVFLRYHYVIDVIGGGLLAVITLYTWRAVRALMIRTQQWITAR